MVEIKSEKIGTVQAQEVVKEFNRLYEGMKLDIRDGLKIKLTTLGNGKKFTVTCANDIPYVTCTMVADRYTNSLYIGV